MTNPMLIFITDNNRISEKCLGTCTLYNGIRIVTPLKPIYIIYFLNDKTGWYLHSYPVVCFVSIS